jgi:hypothetical protein
MNINHLDNLPELLKTLEMLAIHGTSRCSAQFDKWLSFAGIVTLTDDQQWMMPTQGWLTYCLPAQNQEDLLRNSLIRDSMYRMHLDLAIGSVLQAIGKAERWKRLEELLTGKFLPFCPRFIQLLEWLSERNGISIDRLTDNHWSKADRDLNGESIHLFSAWDRELWGAEGQAAVLFPLLESLYIPLIEKPVHIHIDPENYSDQTQRLVAVLMAAAEQGEGVVMPSSFEQDAKFLQEHGLPTRIFTTGPGIQQKVLCLIGATTIEESTYHAEKSLSQKHIPSSIPPSVKQAAKLALNKQEMEGADSLIDSFERNNPIRAFISISDEWTIWPTEAKDEELLPPNKVLPKQKIINKIGHPRSKSLEADEALLRIGSHSYFGFLLQLLLLEALDRELGEETLILVPPTFVRLEDIEKETKVFYQPKQAGVTENEENTLWSFNLGLVDEVIDQTAKNVGISQVVMPYKTRWGPWSRGLHLFRTAEIMVGLPDRWALAPHVLDRLHGGGLMSAIIRKGRIFRGKIHEALKTLWKEKLKENERLEGERKVGGLH